ncbi:MAG: hypothetical protein LKI58_07830 [Actinomyces sp.]|nr:hypothetical protein [Actinomyces sp.]MCI1787960.1 hypothetical protein [Actinomyces sp.]MCI1867080.1 hypothetical protein [Actinomyces sp.]
MTGRTEILGLVTTTSVAYGPSSMLLAVELAARRAGYFTGVAPVSGTSGNTVTAAVDHFLRLGAEGLVVFAPTEDIARDLSALDVPVPVVAVTARRTTPRAGGVTPVSVDQHGGQQIAQVPGKALIVDQALVAVDQFLVVVAGPRVDGEHPGGVVHAQHMAARQTTVDQSGQGVQ